LELGQPVPGGLTAIPESEDQPYCEVLTCYGRPADLSGNLRGSSLEPQEMVIISPWEPILALLGFIGLFLLLAPYYDQRIARMLRAFMPIPLERKEDKKKSR